MAINRDIIYYDEWTTSINGWRVRLEIIPAGLILDLPSDKERLRHSVLSVKPGKYSFKDFPVGAWQCPTLQIEVDLEHCPANLREMLQDPIFESVGQDVTNRFMLYSDRGDAGLAFENWFVEFCGVQPFSVGSKRSINAKTLAPRRMTVEVFDMFSVITQEFATSRFCGYFYSIAPTLSVKALYNTETPNLLATSYAPKISGGDATIHLYSLLDTFGANMLYPLTWLDWPVWTRGDLGTSGTVNASGTVLDAVKFYAQDNDAAHGAGDPLSDVLLIGLITEFSPTDISAERLGGLFMPNSGGAEYREYATMYDLLNDLAKSFWVKLRWKYGRYTFSTTNDNVSVTLHWNRRLDNYGMGAYHDIDITKAIGEITLEDAYNVVRTGEAEIPNVGDDDVDKRVVETGGLRNAATWNVKLLHNNQVPIASADYGASSGISYYGDDAIILRCLFYNDGGKARKVHEDVSIYDKNAVSSLYSDIIAPSTSSLDYYNRWVSKTQIAETGLAYATAQHAVTVFGKKNQSKLEVTLVMDAATGLLPCNVGEMFNIAAITGEVSSTEWSLLEAEPDWLTGSMKCVFISKGI